jgi:cell division protein FtsZ
VKGIADLITYEGYINVDFNDVKTIMGEMGLALMGTGVGRGENRASQAVQQAISSPLLEDISIHGARAVLINISAGPDLGMHEFEEANAIIQKEVNEEANIILGLVVNEQMGDEIRVTVIATGIGKVEQTVKPEAPATSRLQRYRPEGMSGDVNYDVLQIPTIVRHRGERAEGAPQNQQPKKRTFLQRLTGSTPEEEDLSIPTFIRRQAD